MEILAKKIAKWHHERNLIKGATDKDQFCKLIQEAGELSDNICKGKDISDDIGMSSLGKEFQFDVVINLAAQAGVQYSLKNTEVKAKGLTTAKIRTTSWANEHQNLY